MPKVKTLKERLAAQQKKIKDAEDALVKIKEKETKRIFEIFEAEGFFDADITDDQLRTAISDLVRNSAGSQSFIPPETVSETA